MNPGPRPSSSRTVLIVLSIVGAFLLLCCGGLGFFGFRMFRAAARLDEAADRFALSTLQSVAKPWNAGKLWDVSDDDLKHTITRQQHDQLVAVFADKLGNLKSCGPFSANSTHINDDNGNRSVLVRTAATAQFEKGEGKVTFTLLRHGTQWTVDGINIVSPLLLPATTPSPSASATGSSSP